MVGGLADVVESIDQGQWLGEQVALGKPTTQTDEFGQLDLGRDAFGDWGKAQFFGQRQNHPHQLGVTGDRAQAVDQASVDFDKVGGQFAQKGQVRMARAEVVDCQTNAQRTQIVQLRLGRLQLVHRDFFGDLYGDRSSRNTRASDGPSNMVDKTLVGQLHRGQVDGHRQMRHSQAKFSGCSTGFGEHFLAQTHGQPRRFGNTQKLGRSQ